jgi:large subunit ribosomal protein L13|tara:strand:- start:295 stop:723 length:429 start_codon:yes stop_codon:yes gene_type:complete
MNTRSFKKSDIQETWILLDAKGKTLGRFATQIAKILSGKNKPEYTPNADMGDFVVVVNAKDIHVTGKKEEQKRYYRHSGYPGGIKSKLLGEMLDDSASEVIKSAVKGMLPKSKLGRKMFTKLKVYEDSEHPHVAQNPQLIEL